MADGLGQDVGLLVCELVLFDDEVLDPAVGSRERVLDLEELVLVGLVLLDHDLQERRCGHHEPLLATLKHLNVSFCV